VQAHYRPRTPLQLSKKRKQQSSCQGREYWYGRPKSLKYSDTYRNSKKEIKPIQIPKKNIPSKNPRGIPSMVRNSDVVGKPPTGFEV
jgi:hypothetical protein